MSAHPLSPHQGTERTAQWNEELPTLGQRDGYRGRGGARRHRLLERVLIGRQDPAGGEGAIVNALVVVVSQGAECAHAIATKGGAVHQRQCAR